jgi:hypothetical protein
VANATVFAADFTGFTPGAGSATTLDIAVARSSSNATVQTSASTVTSGIGTNTGRIFSDGTHTGLLLEESRTNLVGDSDNLTAGSWSAGTATTTRPLTPSGPDSQSLASRVANIGDQAGAFAQGTFGAGAVVASWWSRTTGGSAGKGQGYLYDGTNVVASMHNIDGSWSHHAITQSGSHASASCQFAVHSGHDWTASGGGNPGNMDNVYRLLQLELASFATSHIATSGGTAIRAADLASTTTDLRVSGALKIEFSLLPLGASSQYGADQFLWWKDASNNAKIVQSTRKIAVTLNGVTDTLGVAVPAYSALDTVKIYVECGGGLTTHAWASVNGTVTDVGTGSVLANVPSGTTYLLNNSTAGVLSSIVQYVKAYR